MLLRVTAGVCCLATVGAILTGGTAQDKQDGDLEAQGSIDYPSYYHGDGYHHHHYRDVSYVNDAAVKALLIPLAGVALLGAAAIAAANPILLQIGVLTGKKRRRREVSSLQQLRIIESFLGQLPKEEVLNQERKLQAQYLQCSGIVNTDDLCFERITCELGKPKTNSTELQRNVLDIVTNEIMKNEYINPQFKFRLREARRIGLSSGNCFKYNCIQIDSQP